MNSLYLITWTLTLIISGHEISFCFTSSWPQSQWSTWKRISRECLGKRPPTQGLALDYPPCLSAFQTSPGTQCCRSKNVFVEGYLENSEVWKGETLDYQKDYSFEEERLSFPNSEKNPGFGSRLWKNCSDCHREHTLLPSFLHLNDTGMDQLPTLD